MAKGQHQKTSPVWCPSGTQPAWYYKFCSPSLLSASLPWGLLASWHFSHTGLIASLLSCSSNLSSLSPFLLSSLLLLPPDLLFFLSQRAALLHDLFLALDPSTDLPSQRLGSSPPLILLSPPSRLAVSLTHTSSCRARGHGWAPSCSALPILASTCPPPTHLFNL